VDVWKVSYLSTVVPVLLTWNQILRHVAAITKITINIQMTWVLPLSRKCSFDPVGIMSQRLVHGLYPYSANVCGTNSSSLAKLRGRPVSQAGVCMIVM
jgi:hypothetical protein